MALFDIIDDIAEKQVTKTDTGDNRIWGVVIGQVVNNYEEKMPGRVCVSIPVRDKEANELKWARVAEMYYGAKYGTYFLPEVGDQVLVVFEQGNIEKPYIIGCIPKDNSSFLKGAVKDKNQLKKITTKHGSTITFEDHEEGDGDKDKITISTAKEGHTIALDNEHKSITITDKDKKNSITIQTEKGVMEVAADKKIHVKVGEIELTMNGSNGTVELSATKLKISCSGGIEAESNANLKLQGSNTQIGANATLKLSSDGVVQVSGTPIKIG